MDNPVTADHYPIWSLLFVTSIVQQNTEILSWYMKQDCLSFQPTEAYLRVQVCPKVEHKWRASHSLKSTLMSTSYEECTLKQSCAEYTRPRRSGTDHVLILYVLACASLHSPPHRRGAHHVLVLYALACVRLHSRPHRRGAHHVLVLYVLACASLHSPPHRRGAHHVLVLYALACVRLHSRPHKRGAHHVLVLYVLACVRLHSCPHRRGAHHVLVSTLPLTDVEHTMCY